MRFIVDGMLGGLARWLRILGHEVVYDKARNDNAMLDSALQDKMILLTRDEELSERAAAKNVMTLLVKGLTEEERMAQVAKKFGVPLEIDMAKTRCPECGTELRQASRSEVSRYVPVKSLALYKEFWQCKDPGCGKVYWMGSHWRQITTTVAKAKKLAKTSRDPCLSIKEGTLLVKAARAAIESHLKRRKIFSTPSAEAHLARPLGVFVTLLDFSKGGHLRGCIGNPFPARAIIDQVPRMAVEAATSDPRFPPIRAEELKSNITIEVSVLTIPEAIRVGEPIQYRDEIVVGRDGLIVEGFGRRGLLLPQVAVDEGFDSEEFLSQSCLKAGLLPDAWLSRKIGVWKFQGQVFSEEKPEGRVFERNLASGK